VSNQQKTFWESIWKTDSKEGIWTHELWKEVSPEIVSLIQSQSPDERPDVLDLGCGLGRHTIAFAQAGFNVTGVDLSLSAIMHARGWADELGLHTFGDDGKNVAISEIGWQTDQPIIKLKH